MKKIKPWLVLVLVFVAGFISGAVVTRAVVRRTVQVALTNPDRVRDLIEKRIAARVKLDAEQRQRVHQILADSQGNLKELRREFAPRFTFIFSNSEARISSLLTPEQRQRLEKLREENRHLWPAPLSR
jgi:Spy/CpxP family protein refolding chaperone